MAFRDLALRRLEIGGGLVQGELPEGVRLAIPAKAAGYADAQLDDTHRRRRSEFPWRPPVQMRLRARASHAAPGGTLGFGFWNDPFGFSLGQGGAAARLPAAPDAVWFFYASPPADLRFTPGIAGSGWKAMSLSTRRIPSLALLAIAPMAALLALLRTLRRPILSTALRSVHAGEAALGVSLDTWHDYALDWRAEVAEFSVDGRLLLRASQPPKGPLGLVLWIDNQYATATVESGFRFGLVAPTEAQWLEIEEFEITSNLAHRTPL
jgi:hypothetical protein